MPASPLVEDIKLIVARGTSGVLRTARTLKNGLFEFLPSSDKDAGNGQAQPTSYAWQELDLQLAVQAHKPLGPREGEPSLPNKL